jgi:hypothetical protein
MLLISLRYALTLTYSLRLDFPSVLRTSGTPNKILYSFIVLPMRAAAETITFYLI